MKTQNLDKILLIEFMEFFCLGKGFIDSDELNRLYESSPVASEMLAKCYSMNRSQFRAHVHEKDRVYIKDIAIKIYRFEGEL